MRPCPALLRCLLLQIREMGTKKPIQHELRTARMSEKDPAAQAASACRTLACHAGLLSREMPLAPVRHSADRRRVRARYEGPRSRRTGRARFDRSRWCPRLSWSSPSATSSSAFAVLTLTRPCRSVRNARTASCSPGFQLRANVRHLCEHTLPALPGPRSDERPFRPVTAAAPVQEHLFAVLGTVGLLRTGRDVD